jgi:hypothetical protein
LIVKKLAKYVGKGYNYSVLTDTKNDIKILHLGSSPSVFDIARGVDIGDQLS